jgi:hypothetical protein
MPQLLEFELFLFDHVIPRGGQARGNDPHRVGGFLDKIM